MLGGSFDLNWPALIAVVFASLVGGLIALVWLIREHRGRRMRVGFFVERDVVEPVEKPPTSEDS